jgi:hypothetical protein
VYTSLPFPHVYNAVNAIRQVNRSLVALESEVEMLRRIMVFGTKSNISRKESQSLGSPARIRHCFIVIIHARQLLCQLCG